MNTKPNRKNRSSLLCVIAVTLETESGMPSQTARQLAAQIVGGIRKQMRGEMLYVANADEADRADRDAAIRRDYDGTRPSRERLQLRWDISRAQFYRIINSASLTLPTENETTSRAI